MLTGGRAELPLSRTPALSRTHSLVLNSFVKILSDLTFLYVRSTATSVGGGLSSERAPRCHLWSLKKPICDHRSSRLWLPAATLECLAVNVKTCYFPSVTCNCCVLIRRCGWKKRGRALNQSLWVCLHRGRREADVPSRRPRSLPVVGAHRSRHFLLLVPCSWCCLLFVSCSHNSVGL